MSGKAPALVAALALAFAAAAAPAKVRAQSVTAFEGARLIDGNGGAVVENATIVVDGQRIVIAGPAASVAVPAGARRVSLAGKTVMPMIIDAHVHLGLTREQVLKDLRQRVYWGVGAVLSAGIDPYSNLDIRNEALPASARFLSAGRGITMPEPGRITVPHWINNEEEGRRAVAELAEKKVDIVKIWVDNRGGKYKKLSPEICAAIIDEAHKRNLRVLAHIFDMEDAKHLVRSGVDAFAHGVRDKDIDDEVVALFKQRSGLVLTPNLPERGVKTDLTWLKPGMTADEYAKIEAGNVDKAQEQAFYGIQARNLAKLNAAGIRIVMGTDGNRPWGPHVEMEDMVAAGMTPMQVIVAATRNSAELLRLADQGTIAAGKSADFIVLDANPLDAITNTRKISAVYHKGQAVDRSQPVR